jgi:hypothetical protein
MKTKKRECHYFNDLLVALNIEIKATYPHASLERH